MSNAYKRGDIIAVPFPFTDLSSSKLRPALIISNDSISNTGDVVIVMITSQNKEDGYTISITELDVNEALPKNSFVRCHRIATIDQSIIYKKIGEATPDFTNKIVGLIQAILK
jgi:mRNA interferase MazF